MSAENPAFEKCYRVKELAEIWKFSENTVRKLIKNEPGVVVLEGDGKYSGKRGYKTRIIPESVAQKALNRLTQKPLKVKLATRRPRSIVFLRDCDRRVA
jgi:hypothetical protein